MATAGFMAPRSSLVFQRHALERRDLRAFFKSVYSQYGRRVERSGTPFPCERQTDCHSVLQHRVYRLENRSRYAEFMRQLLSAEDWASLQQQKAESD